MEFTDSTTLDATAFTVTYADVEAAARLAWDRLPFDLRNWHIKPGT